MVPFLVVEKSSEQVYRVYDVSFRDDFNIRDDVVEKDKIITFLVFKNGWKYIDAVEFEELLL